MALVLAWVLASICGMSSASSLTIFPSMPTTEMTDYRLVASILAGIIVAFVPLAAAVLAEGRWRRRRTLNDPALEPHPIAPVLIVLLASATLLLMPLALASFNTTQSPLPNATLLTAALFVTVTALLQARYLLGMLYRLGFAPTFCIAIWVVLTWGVPPLLDLMWTATERGSEARDALLLPTWSPAGLLLASLDTNHTNWISGPLVQTLTTATLAAVYHVTNRSKAHTPS